MMQSEIRRKSRFRRHNRIRKALKGTPDRPRLVIHRSSQNISAQVIDDLKGITLAAAASFDKGLKGKLKNGGNIEAAKAVGQQIAKLATEKSISRVVFDRGGYFFHGRIKALADAARENGLQF